MKGENFVVVRKLDRLVNDGNMSKKLPKLNSKNGKLLDQLINVQRYMIGALMKLMSRGLRYQE